MRISDWSSDVCSSDLEKGRCAQLDISLFASARRIFQKALITRYIGRIQLGDFMAKGILVIAVIELRAVGPIKAVKGADWLRSEEHTSELQSLMRISYAVFCLKKNNTISQHSKANTYKPNYL